MGGSMYGVPMDLYAEDEELNPLAGSGIDPAALSAALDEVALEAKAPPEQDEAKRVRPPEVMGTGGSGPVVTYKPQLRPAGYGAGLDSASLAAAQRADANRTAQNDTGAAIYATFARKPMPAQGASTQARDVMQQRQGVDQEEALQGRQRSAEINAERGDPRSESSNGIRAFLRAVDPKTAEAIGPFLDRMSYTEINERLPYLKDMYARRTAMEAKSAAGRAALKAAQQKSIDEERRRMEDKTFQADQAQLNRDNSSANAQLMAGRQAGARGEAAAAKDQEKTDAQLIKYGEDVAGPAEEFLHQTQVIDGIIAKHKGGDLPGIGGWDDSVLAFDSLRSPDGLAMRKAAGQMQAAYQKMLTGAGASDAERQNLQKISADMSTEKGFVAGYAALKQAFGARLKGRNAGFKPEVLTTYGERNPESGMGLGGGRAQGMVTVSNGKETMQIPEADLAEAERDGFKAVR